MSETDGVRTNPTRKKAGGFLAGLAAMLASDVRRLPWWVSSRGGGPGTAKHFRNQRRARDWAKKRHARMQMQKESRRINRR